MLDLAGFRARYPEFLSAPDPLVQLHLDDAAKRIDESTWGDWANEGHGLLTAHKLTCSPNGQMSRLQTDKNQTTYGLEFEKLQQATSALIRVF